MLAPPLNASTGTGAVISAALLLLFSPLAHAQEADSEAPSPRLTPGLRMSLRLEPGLAVALTDPQADMTRAGFDQTVKVMFGLTRYLELGPSMAFTTLPATPEMTDAGTSWAFGASARLMRPHDAAGGRRGLYAASPWVDADLRYVRTGFLNRAGFAAGAGIAFPLDQQRKFWIGPFVRYSHILQGERVGYDNRDAKILSVGLSLEVGSGLERRREAVAAAEEVRDEPIVVAAIPEPDRDGDGIADRDDNCPDVAGPAANVGCPEYAKVVIKPDKLELTETIAFEWNSPRLENPAYPLLDDVVRALQENRGFRVQVDGHASSEGTDAHNQILSEQRADAVLDYLVAHGVDPERLVSKGFSSSVPAATNKTNAGRIENRRVEFAVSFIIIATKGNTP